MLQGGSCAAQCFDNRCASVNNDASTRAEVPVLSDDDKAAVPDPGDPGEPAREPAVGTGTGARTRTETGETGGPKGLEPTRYGDWERNGRCIDF